MANKEQERGHKDKKSAKTAKAKDEKKPEAAAAPAPKATKKDLGSSTILACTCVSEYQDKAYGKGQRVFNIGSQSRNCTVCGAKR